MIIDAFTFFNEFDLLEARFEYLYDQVDKFIIVEADHTFSGAPKPLNFLNNQSRYKKYLDKVIYFPYKVDIEKYNFSPVINKEITCDVMLETKPEDWAPWQVEIDQRNHIAYALKFFPKDSLVFIGDLDEIPKKSAIELAKTIIPSKLSAGVAIQELFYFNFNQRQQNLWPGTVIATNEYVLDLSPQWVRSNRTIFPQLLSAGYHLSYWSTIKNIQYKIESFSHQEFNHEKYTNHQRISNCIREGIHPFDPTIILMPVQPNQIDKEIFEIFSKYSEIPLT